MILKGKYNECKVYTDKLENQAKEQIINLLNQKAFEGSQIRIMPDVHGGKGCVIGFTGKFKGKVIPNIVGVDIGCGMFAVNLGKINIDLKKLDIFISKEIASGFHDNKKVIAEIPKQLQDRIVEISEKTLSNSNKHMKAIGSLGGGNHFIEINIDDNKNKWLVIHSGSRNFGHQIATFHQKKAKLFIKNKIEEILKEKNKKLNELHKANLPISENIINSFEERKKEYYVPSELSFLEGELANEYLEDMQTAQKFAKTK